MAGIGTLSGSLKTTFQYQGQNAQQGAVYSPMTSNTTITKSLTVSNSVANNTVGGADEAFSFIQTIIGGGKAILNITSGMTNIMQQAAVNLGTGNGRLKMYQFRLLSTSDDSTLTPATGTTSTVTVTNLSVAAAAMDVPIGGFFGSKGSGATVTLTAAGAVTNVAIGAAGTGYLPSAGFMMTPQQAGGSGCVFAATTNSSGVITAMTFIATYGGAGYTGATVPAVEVGSHSLYVGGMLAYGDPSAAGFTSPTTTNKNLLFVNNDAVKNVYIETDFFAGTS